MEKAQENFTEALKIYRELAKSNPSVYNVLVANTLLQFSKALYRTDLTKAIKYVDEAITIYQQTGDSVPAINDRLSACYGRMSRFRLLSKQYDEAEKYAKKAISINGKMELLRKYLAHSFLYQGKFKEAKSIYMELKDKEYIIGETKKFKDLFIEDFDEFEQAGITHPDVAKIRELLKSN